MSASNVDASLLDWLEFIWPSKQTTHTKKSAVQDWKSNNNIGPIDFDDEIDGSITTKIAYTKFGHKNLKVSFFLLSA